MTDPKKLFAVRVRPMDTYSGKDYLMMIDVNATALDLRTALEARLEREHGYPFYLTAVAFNHSGTRLGDEDIVSVACRHLYPDKDYLRAYILPINVTVRVLYGKRSHKAYGGTVRALGDATFEHFFGDVKSNLMPSNAHYNLQAPLLDGKPMKDFKVKMPFMRHFLELGGKIDRSTKCELSLEIATTYVPKEERRVALDSTQMTAAWVDVLHPMTRQKIGEKLEITILDKELRDRIRSIVHMKQLYEATPVVDAMKFAPKLSKLKSSGSAAVRTLALFIEQEYEKLLAPFKEALTEGYVSYDGLWWVFQSGSDVVAQLPGSSHPELVGFQVNETTYERGFMPCFVLQGFVIKSNGKQIYKDRYDTRIPEFEGLVPLRDLTVRPMSEEERALLEKRADTFLAYALDHHYLMYQGTLRVQGFRRVDHVMAKGRVMVDSATFAERNPNQRIIESQPDASMVLDHFPPLQRPYTYPTLPAFSFLSKRWGEVYLSELKPNVFDERAFERLVMDPEKKDLLQALVEEARKPELFTDILQNKGCGTIFLLHGPPGTGKTLTAESIAERMHQPLYSISVGELGTTPEQLESRLDDVLDLCATWGAVVLLDEADIFMEARKNNESAIARNAMVGVFLRKLEYHNGTLFLTTNRVDTFDEAFYSRMSLVMHYQKLSQGNREQIWRNLLGAAKIDCDDAGKGGLPCPPKLAEIELNGREIRHMIRLAQTLAMHDQSIVKMEHIQKTIAISGVFDALIKPSASSSASANSGAEQSLVGTFEAFRAVAVAQGCSKFAFPVTDAAKAAQSLRAQLPALADRIDFNDDFIFFQ